MKAQSKWQRFLLSPIFDRFENALRIITIMAMIFVVYLTFFKIFYDIATIENEPDLTLLFVVGFFSLGALIAFGHVVWFVGYLAIRIYEIAVWLNKNVPHGKKEIWLMDFEK